MSALLICYDCNRRMSQVGAPVTIRVPDPTSKDPKKTYDKHVGFWCIKCCRKKLVETDVKRIGLGWRERFKRFVENIRKTKNKKEEKPVL